MRIKKYKCSQFAGLKDKTIELNDGLNVVLGPNEAGKSTIVEGIYSTLFKQHKLSRKAMDQQFSERFMPKPQGDFFDGELMIEKGDQQYHLSKSWGSTAETKMVLPTGAVIQDANRVEENLKDLLSFGEKTYSNIIFSKQQDLKNAIELILKDEATSDLGTILRRVVMELDGISIDKLKKKLDEEYKALFERWDHQFERPLNPNRRYKAGVGDILEKHYQIEDIKKDIQNSKSIEEKINELSAQLKNLENKRGQLREEIDKYGKIEQDIIKRASKEPKVGHLKEKESNLRKIALSWPQQEEVSSNLGKELQKIQGEIQTISQQLNNAQKIKEKDRLALIISKVAKAKEDIKKLEVEKAVIPNINKQDIEGLEELRSSILTIETAIKAGKMQGRFATENKSIWVTKDFDERKQYQGEGQFTADGYLKIEVGDNVTIEVQSGEFDFAQLKEKLLATKEGLEDKLSSLSIKTIEEGKVNKERIDKLSREIDALKSQVSTLLDGQSYEELKSKFSDLENIKVEKDLSILEEDLKAARSKEMEINSKHYSIKTKLCEWENLYQDPDNLLDQVLEIKGEIKEIKDELETLAALPSEFKSNQEFSVYLNQLRRDLETNHQLYQKAKDDYYELEGTMPESSTEELIQELRTLEKDYNRLLQRGRSLLKVQKVFTEKLEEIDQNSFQPLINGFSKYLTILTLDNYKTVDIDDSFNVDIEKGGVPMPLDLLSTGTKDCVALALRLAIIEVLYDAKPGILVLDDCLVDLDPQRRAKAVELIQQFAQNNQVIFTTCNPVTASQLGGNIINL